MKFTCSWSTQIIKQQIEFSLLDIVLVCQIVWGGNLACWRPLGGWSGKPCQGRGSGSRDEPGAGEEGGSRQERAELGAAEPWGASMGRHLKEWFYSQFSKKPSR